MADSKKGFRLEKDTLGEMLVPAGALYGIQTLRASQNFRISGIRPKRIFIKTTAMVKKAAAIANTGLGLLDKRRGRAIIKAAEEVIEGRYDNEFIVDVYQAGAGTSHNMNANEVIANRAIELLRGSRGDYSIIHPNDHVNMGQSTNDTMPAALRLALIISSADLLASLKTLQKTLASKSKEFSKVLKSGRTHLQDAVPMTLGAEFGSYATSVSAAVDAFTEPLSRLKVLGLGGTATGTGVNSHPLFGVKAISALREIAEIRGLKKAANPYSAINSMADFMAYSGALRETACELIRISNDMRLLGSGPRTGLGEITFPAIQPGSSIMPGKVNPGMAEMLAMVCFQVIGNDMATAMAVQAGQLELNVMLPVINYNTLHSTGILSSATDAFASRFVAGIKAKSARCAEYLENSVGLATILNPAIGYEAAASTAKEAMATGKSIKAVALEKGLISEKAWDILVREAADRKT